MNVEERKQQARLFEQQGEFADALELYEEALLELEGTPEIWRELPLYVKAGDLSLKMGDSSGAIAHYEKAARAYAAYGSSKSVIALCTKILRVNPGHTHAFLRLVRLMIERDHLAEARLVLLEYSELMKLPKAASVLQGMADGSDEELKPLLELLLELGGRYEYARAQGRDEPTVTVSVEESPGAADDHAEEDVTDSSTEDTVRLSSEEQIAHGLTPRVDDDDVAERLIDSEPEETLESDSREESESDDEEEFEGEPEQASDETTTPTAAETPSAEEVQWVDERPSARVSMPHASRQVLFREGENRKNKPKALWIALGAVAVIVVGGLSLLLFGVIPLGGDGGTSPQTVSEVDSTDSAQTAGIDSTESTDVARDSSTAIQGEAARNDAAEEADVGEGSVTAGTDDPAVVAQAVDDSGEAEGSTGDTTATEQPAVLDDSPVAQMSPELPASRGVMVQDFDIESTTEFTADGRVGFRVTQVLGTGEIITLSAIYYGEDIGSAPGTEEVTLTPLVGDTTTAIMHFNGYAVEARAIVSASVLQTLLSRLTEAPPSN